MAHLLQQPTVESRDEAAGVYTTRCAFHYVETRQDEQSLYAGWATHSLVAQPDGSLRIRLKRVDLARRIRLLGVRVDLVSLQAVPTTVRERLLARSTPI